MKHIKSLPGFLLPLMVAILLFNTRCATTIVRELRPPPLIPVDSSINDVKVHMKDGSLYVLKVFDMDNNSDTAFGFGTYYDQYRNVIRFNTDPSGQWIADRFLIPIPDVALVEMNKLKNKMAGKIIGITLVSAATIGVTAYCLANPKACFGSCPTFYSWNGTDTTLIAEGFSSSILRRYEQEDIDMLYSASSTDNSFNLRLTNEALETHVIRYADVMVLPRGDADRVFATETGEFFHTYDIAAPLSCQSPEGDCLEKLILMDKRERYSPSDPENLIAKESVEITFSDVPRGELGFIIGCRQSFMTTYLFYQGLAYLGKSAGYFAAKIESGDKLLQRKFDRIKDLLGAIEVFVQDPHGRWISAGEIAESGPLASDVHLIRLPDELCSENLNTRLRMTKGLWRIDYVAIGRLGQEIDPIVVEPAEIVVKNSSGINTPPFLKDPQRPLVTLPGDVYEIKYDIPDVGGPYDLFLKSRGYYLEWIREPWLQEENHVKAALFFGLPKLYMKNAGDEFKKAETTLEECFWKSRYVGKN
ncbi:MAG: hypothetical protein IH591_16900 [Bacteroidales bacterium]|nr:hypothetical protein [Bacteroidales bacterium]